MQLSREVWWSKLAVSEAGEDRSKIRGWHGNGCSKAFEVVEAFELDASKDMDGMNGMVLFNSCT